MDRYSGSQGVATELAAFLRCERISTVAPRATWPRSGYAGGMLVRRFAFVLIVAAVAAGCGGSSASAKERVAACIDRYPDATKADCEEWDDAGELDDDGTHEGHEDMEMG